MKPRVPIPTSSASSPTSLYEAPLSGCAALSRTREGTTPSVRGGPSLVSLGCAVPVSFTAVDAGAEFLSFPLPSQGAHHGRNPDQGRSQPVPYDNPQVHNRWHPDIPMAVWVEPGAEFKLETYDWTGGAIKNDDSAEDVRDVDLSTVHFLSGPVGVKGAEPGDLLVVDLLDIGARDDSLWGFNGFFSKQNGGGFLDEHFPLAQKSIWDFHGMFTKSRHIPGVNFAGLIHPGLIGCLPDPKMLASWNERETGLIATDPDRIPGLANPPNATTAHMGQMQGEARDKAAAEGARPCRRASMAATATSRTSRAARACSSRLRGRRGPERGRPALQPGRWRNHLLRRHRDGRLGAHEGLADQGRHGQVRHQEPHLQAQPHDAQLQGLPDLRRHLGGRKGKQHYLDVTVAYRQACLNAIEYLKKFGYSGAQAYSLLGTAPVQGHISGVVDVPNACATLWLPTEIFDFDINPTAEGPQKIITGGVDLPIAQDK